MPTKMRFAKYIRRYKLEEGVWKATNKVDRLPRKEAHDMVQKSLGEWRWTTKDIWEGLRK